MVVLLGKSVGTEDVALTGVGDVSTVVVSSAGTGDSDTVTVMTSVNETVSVAKSGGAVELIPENVVLGATVVLQDDVPVADLKAGVVLLRKGAEAEPVPLIAVGERPDVTARVVLLGDPVTRGGETEPVPTTPVGEGPDVSVMVVRLGNVVGTEGATIGLLLAEELLDTVKFPEAVLVESRVLQDRLHVKTLDSVVFRPALTDVPTVGAVVSVMLTVAGDVTPDDVQVVLLTNVEGATVGSNGLLVVLGSEVGRLGAVVRLVASTGMGVIVVVKVIVMMTGGGDAVPVIETKTELSSLVGVTVVFAGIVLFALVGNGTEGNVTVVLATLESKLEEGAGAPVPGTAGVVEFA
jgi:hypothetical protein